MAQEPWNDVPVVPLSQIGGGQSRPAQSADGSIRRRADGSTYAVVNEQYTNESPTELLNQGYEQDPETGNWFRSVGEADFSQMGVNILSDEDIARRMEQERVREAELSALRSDPLSAFASSATEQIPFLDEAAAGVTGLITGRSYDEVRGLQRDLQQYDRENQAVARNAGGVAGFATGFAAPGSTFIQGGRGAGQILRAATVGGGYGAAYGSGAADDSYASRLQGAIAGGVTGAVGGGAIQGGLNYASRLRSIASPPRVQPGERVPVSGTPEQMAAARIVRTMEPGAITERQRLTDLGLSPSVMDVSGGTTERLLRTAAAPAGEGANAAVQNAAQRSADLRPEIMTTTRGLARDQRSAQTVREGLEQSRDALASTEYAPAYASPVTLTPEAVTALRGQDGQAAIQRALRGAEANGDVETINELRGLIGAELDQLPTVSGRTLDRVRIAMRDMSSNFLRGDNPDRVMSAGYAGRVRGIDTALDTAPGLTDARAAFRERSGAIDAIDNRPDIFSTDPRDFASWVRGLTPEQREAATIGVRQDILDQLGGQANAGTRSLDRLTQSQYSRQNLSALLGEEAANQYLSSISARVQQAQRAARVSPNTNSQTFGRGLDEQTFQTAEALGAVSDAGRGLVGDTPALARTVDRVVTAVRARSMTPEVRNEIVRLGLGSADELERILMLADEARAAGRPVPRAVRRYVERVRNVAGASVSQRFENALLPLQSAAEEEQVQQ